MKFGNQRLLSTGVHGKNITPWNLLYVLYVRVYEEKFIIKEMKETRIQIEFFFFY